jgi:tripartite-type tricarboxylate transporter receptor subunit TctC
MKMPNMQKRFFDLGLDSSGMSPQELSALIKADVPRLGKVVKDSGARAD